MKTKKNKLQELVARWWRRIREVREPDAWELTAESSAATVDSFVHEPVMFTSLHDAAKEAVSIAKDRGENIKLLWRKQHYTVRTDSTIDELCEEVRKDDPRTAKEIIAQGREAVRAYRWANGMPMPEDNRSDDDQLRDLALAWAADMEMANMCGSKHTTQSILTRPNKSQ